MVTCIGIGGLQVGLLSPGSTASCKDIHRTAAGCTVIALVRRIAVFIRCANRQRIPRERYRIAELVTCTGVGGLQVSLLSPGSTASCKDIHRTADGCTGVALDAPDTPRIAVFIRCTNRQRIPRERYRIAELVTFIGVGGLQVGLREPIAGNTQRIDAGIGGYRKGEGHILCFTEVHTLSRYLDRIGGGTGGSVCRNRTPNRTGAADIQPARFG